MKNNFIGHADTCRGHQISNDPIVGIKRYARDHSVRTTLDHNGIIISLVGECHITSDQFPEKILQTNQAAFLPIGSTVTLNALSDLEIMVIRLEPQIKFCSLYDLESLHKLDSLIRTEDGSDATILNINNKLRSYIQGLVDYLDDGMNCPEFLELKMREFMYLMRHYFSAEQLAGFYRYSLNDDSRFAYLIQEHWHDVKSVTELACICAYSLTAFGKKFKKVFGMLPSEWLNNQKKLKLLYELRNTEKPLKYIADELRFNTQQQLNEFCVRNFGMTPNKLRLEKKNLSDNDKRV